MKLTEDIETAFENRKKCGAVFVDLSAAYDTVRHRGLALKMLQLLPNKHMVQFIRELILQTEASNYTLANTVQIHTASRTACLKVLSLLQCNALQYRAYTCMTFRKLHQQNACMLMILL